ncbi:MAG: hypothetical protein AVDCRST_MAG35-1390 [uncultured Quadrisphaera sp.]|uniref:Uncharacterized protein n=1 Tax=uncultured Quadrisphaera sp. TaxID=904978 RepID=A0A6J4PG99_9ACTN|nr:MAG: hypothetical protein AVDCRST_MAG35-1390 [uncultured Quadrisphaera sp.]
MPHAGPAVVRRARGAPVQVRADAHRAPRGWRGPETACAGETVVADPAPGGRP